MLHLNKVNTSQGSQQCRKLSSEYQRQSTESFIPQQLQAITTQFEEADALYFKTRNNSVIKQAKTAEHITRQFQHHPQQILGGTFFEPIQINTVNILDNFSSAKDRVVNKVVQKKQFFDKKSSHTQFWYQSFYPTEPQGIQSREIPQPRSKLIKFQVLQDSNKKTQIQCLKSKESIMKTGTVKSHTRLNSPHSKMLIIQPSQTFHHKPSPKKIVVPPKKLENKTKIKSSRNLLKINGEASTQNGQGGGGGGVAQEFKVIIQNNYKNQTNQSSVQQSRLESEQKLSHKCIKQARQNQPYKINQHVEMLNMTAFKLQQQGVQTNVIQSKKKSMIQERLIDINNQIKKLMLRQQQPLNEEVGRNILNETSRYSSQNSLLGLTATNQTVRDQNQMNKEENTQSKTHLKKFFTYQNNLANLHRAYDPLQLKPQEVKNKNIDCQKQSKIQGDYFKKRYTLKPEGYSSGASGSNTLSNTRRQNSIVQQVRLIPSLQPLIVEGNQKHIVHENYYKQSPIREIRDRSYKNWHLDVNSQEGSQESNERQYSQMHLKQLDHPSTQSLISNENQDQKRDEKNIRKNVLSKLAVRGARSIDNSITNLMDDPHKEILNIKYTQQQNPQHMKFNGQLLEEYLIRRQKMINQRSLIMQGLINNSRSKLIKNQHQSKVEQMYQVFGQKPSKIGRNISVMQTPPLILNQTFTQVNNIYL